MAPLLSRSTTFHYIFLTCKPMIKHTIMMSANYESDHKIVWVPPGDISSAMADEIVIPLTGKKVRNIAIDELTCNETADVSGAANGKPDLK